MDPPQRELLLMRHAEASGAGPGAGDHGRPLTDRGRRAASCVGQWLGREGVPERIVSSTAERARTTARIVAETCGYAGPLLEVPELYLAGAMEGLRVPAELAADQRSVLLVGHNPGLEDLLALLTGKRAGLGTAALARIVLPIADWSELQSGVRGDLIQLWRPVT